MITLRPYPYHRIAMLCCAFCFAVFFNSRGGRRGREEEEEEWEREQGAWLGGWWLVLSPFLPSLCWSYIVRSRWKREKKGSYPETKEGLMRVYFFFLY